MDARGAVAEVGEAKAVVLPQGSRMSRTLGLCGDSSGGSPSLLKQVSTGELERAVNLNLRRTQN